MALFDSKEKKEILKARSRYQQIIHLEKSDYLALNALAKTFADESKLPETKDKEICLEQAVENYKLAIAAGSLEADPYMFLYDYYVNRSPSYAETIEKQGLEFLIMQSDRRMAEINKTVKPNDKLELHAKLAAFCERFTQRTKDMRYKEKLIQFIGGPELYDMSLAYAEL